jgi:hypothetical protein
MKVLTNKKLKEVLKQELHARDAEFHLQRWDNRASGRIISRVFKGMGDSDRQSAILDALERRFGPDGYKLIGMLLAFTPDEWNMKLEGHVNGHRKKKSHARQ